MHVRRLGDLIDELKIHIRLSDDIFVVLMILRLNVGFQDKRLLRKDDDVLATYGLTETDRMRWKNFVDLTMDSVTLVYVLMTRSHCNTAANRVICLCYSNRLSRLCRQY